MELINLQSERISEEREKIFMLTQAVEYGNEPESLIKLAMLENEIDEATYKASIDLVIHLAGSEKTEHDNAWRTYIERTSRLEKQQAQAF